MDDISEEEFRTACDVYAHFLQIDMKKEPELYSVAEDALLNLPAGWDLGIGEGKNAGIPYFYHSESGKSVWHHPEEALWKKRLEVARIQLAAKRDNSNRAHQATNAQAQGNNNNNTSNAANSNSNNRRGANDSDSERENARDNTEILDFSDISSHDGDKRRGNSEKPIARKAGGNDEKKDIEKSAVRHENAPSFGMKATDFFDIEDESASHPKLPQQQNMRNTGLADRAPGIQNTTRKETNIAPIAGNNPPKSELRGWASDVAAAGASNTGPGKVNTASNASYARDDGRQLNSDQQQQHRGLQRRDENDDRQRGAEVDSSRGRPQERDWDRSREREQQQHQRAASEERSDKQRSSASWDNNKAATWDNNKAGRDSRDNRDSGNSNSSGDADKANRNWEQINNQANKFATDKEILSLNAEIRRLSMELEDTMRRKEETIKRSDGEIEVLRGLLNKSEERLTYEKEERRIVELKLMQLQGEVDGRIRDTADSVESRYRDSIKRQRQELEEENKEMRKAVEKRYNEEIESMRIENINARRKIDELTAEAEAMKRRLNLSKEDGRLEAQQDIESAKRAAMLVEEQKNALVSELKKLREEYANNAAKLAQSLQQAQIASAEAEAARVQAVGAKSESQTGMAALFQATQRIQMLDNERSQLQADVLMLKRQNETLITELHQLKMHTEIGGDRESNIVAESRRVKSQLEGDLSRARSRVTELDVQKKQLESLLEEALRNENGIKREIDVQKEKLGYEINRLNDKIAEVTTKYEKESNRALLLEREIDNLQLLLERKDKELKDTKSQREHAIKQVNEIKSMYEDELDCLKEKLAIAEQSTNLMRIQADKEINSLKAEVEQRIPLIASKAMHSVEEAWAARLEKEKAAMRQKFELELERLKRENLDTHANAVQNEARNRAMYADDRAELERLRRNNHRLQQTVEDLENELDAQTRKLRRSHRGPRVYDGHEAAQGAMQAMPLDAWSSADYDGNFSADQQFIKDDLINMRPSIQAPLNSNASRPNGNKIHSNLNGNVAMMPALPMNPFTPMNPTGILNSHAVSNLQDHLDTLKKQLSSVLHVNNSRYSEVDGEGDTEDIGRSLLEVSQGLGQSKARSPESLIQTPNVMASSSMHGSGNNGHGYGDGIRVTPNQEHVHWSKHAANMNEATIAMLPGAAIGHSGYSSMSSVASDDMDDDGLPIVHNEEVIGEDSTHLSFSQSGNESMSNNARYSSTPVRNNKEISNRQRRQDPEDVEPQRGLFDSPASSIFDTPKLLRKKKTQDRQQQLLSQRDHDSSILDLSTASGSSLLRDYSELNGSFLSESSSYLSRGNMSISRSHGFIGGIAMLPKEDMLSNMSDGGYHSNYWKVKYQR